MINMLIQHYGAGTTLTRKITASLEALQLEIGCVGSPFAENYDELHLLTTACWTKSLWERLHYYKFRIHLDYHRSRGAYEIHSATGNTPPTGGGIGSTMPGTIFSFIWNAMERQ